MTAPYTNNIAHLYIDSEKKNKLYLENAPPNSLRDYRISNVLLVETAIFKRTNKQESKVTYHGKTKSATVRPFHVECLKNQY
jgi:hypothetical protein